MNAFDSATPFGQQIPINDHFASGANVDISQSDLDPDFAVAAHSMTTRKTVEYLYTTTALGLRVSALDPLAVAGAPAFDPATRWCLLEFRVDARDIDGEVARYFSMTAPRAILQARQALSDAKVRHLTGIAELDLDLEEAEQRWSKACKQKLQTLRVKLTGTGAKSAPASNPVGSFISNGVDAMNRGASDGDIKDTLRPTLVPHYFVYLGSDVQGDIVSPVTMAAPTPARLRARNYLGSWLHEDDVEVEVETLPMHGWPLPAFRRWITEVVAARQKKPDDRFADPGNCVIAAAQGQCFVMDLDAFTRHYLAPDSVATAAKRARA